MVMSNLIEHAKREFKRSGYTPLDEEQEDGPNKWMQENVLELIEVFSKQGHSGMSASFAIDAFKKLANYKLLTSVKSAEEFDFVETSMGGSLQSRVISSVFQEEGGEYDIDAIVFKNQKGHCFTTSLTCIGYKHAYIKYPFVPKTFYLDVIEKEVRPDDWEIVGLADESQLADVREYFRLE